METLFWILVFISFFTYIGYGILLYILVKIKEIIRPPKQKVLPEILPPVTLFIAAYNEEDFIKEKMENCMDLDYPKEKVTILWVTDGSNDNTNELLNEYPNVQVLFIPERQGKTAAINRGIAFVEDELVVFSDANSMLNKDSLKVIVVAFTDPKVGCVSGEKRIDTKDSDATSSKGEGAYWKYESKLKELDSRLYSVVGAAGELFAVRTPLYEQLPNDTLLDDFMESMLITKKKYKTAYCPRAYATEGGSLNMAEESIRKVRIASGGLQSVWRLRALLNIFKYGILSFQYISHRVLRWTITPFAFFLLLPLNIYLYIYAPHWMYSIMLFMQCLFYFCGVMGYILEKRNKKNKILYIPYYFLFMNINVFKGILYLRKKKGSGAWEKSKRKMT